MIVMQVSIRNTSSKGPITTQRAQLNFIGVKNSCPQSFIGWIT